MKGSNQSGFLSWQAPAHCLPAILFLALLGCLFGPISAPAVAQTPQIASNKPDYWDLYNQVLNVLFPITPEPTLQKYFLSVTLRFKPSVDPESQINIVRDAYGYFRVAEYFLPPGSKRIDSELSELYSKDELDTYDPALLAKRFKVETRSVDISASALKNLLKQLDHLHFPSMETDPRPISFGFESQHDLWYKTFADEVTFSSESPQKNKGYARPIVDWMDRVKQAVDSAPTVQPPKPPPIPAGIETGSISGVVVDADGKAIENAAISVVNQGTRMRWPVTRSAPDGAFTIAGLPPGKYSVTIQQTYFIKFARRDVPIVADKVYQLKVTLEIDVKHLHVSTVEFTPLRMQRVAILD
jgi:hypothetical protein